MVEERDSDRIAAVASAYQAAQFSGDWSKLTRQQTETHLDFGTRETTTQAASRSEDHRQRVESQELVDGGDGSVTRAVLGESRTTFEEGQARTVNRILDGGSILTIFHEEAHGFRRRAHQNGSLTISDDIAVLRAVDTVLAGKTTGEGKQQLRLLPENFYALSPKDQETAIDEGISRLMEAEVLRTRKGGGVRELPAGIISKNLSALSRLAGDKSVGKFRAFVRAVRAHFGLAIDRATEIRRGLEDGTISREDYEAYLSNLQGSANSQTEGVPPLGTSESYSIEGRHGNPDGRPDPALSQGGTDESSQAATFVGKVWYAFAKHEKLFQFRKSDSQDALDIANKLSTPGKPIAAEVVRSDTNPGEFTITFYGSNGYIEVKDAHTDRPYISSMYAGSRGSPGGGGSQLYMAALDWIHNNGKTIRDDPGGLSPINEVRRTSNFLASALRWKTTKHLFPHADQAIGKWTTNDDINLQKLAIREMKNVRKVVRASRATRGWTFDFDNGKFIDARGNELTEKDLTDAVLRSNPGNRGIGLSTLQRAIITGAALRELHSGGNEVAVVPVVSTLPSSLEGISYSLDSTDRPRLTPESFKSAIVNLIGEDQLRTVQPNVSYEDKVKLIDDFSHGVLREGLSPESPDSQSPDEESRDWDYSTPDIGQPGGIQILEQRLANDLLIDTQVRFLGETIRTAEDLAVKAMAIRNPMFETFYIFALKPDPNSDPAEQKMIVADVMALSNRIPCSSHSFIPPGDWTEGARQHAAFLKASDAKDYLFLHNHPSGDPKPSGADRRMTMELLKAMTDRNEGYRFHGHIVINHKRFERIDDQGSVHPGTIPDHKLQGTPEEFDKFAWPRNSTSIGVDISEGASIAKLAQHLEEKKANVSQLVGFFTNSRQQTVAVTMGTEDQFRLLTRDQLRDFARSHGGSRLYLHASSNSRDQAMELVGKFEEMNYYHRLFDLVVEFTNPDGSHGYLSAKELGKFDPIPEFFGGTMTREKPQIIHYSP